MILFFDTSALVKFFHEEKGSETVTNLVLSKDNEIWISELARIEFLSAIFRRFRNREVDDEQLRERPLWGLKSNLLHLMLNL
jgi:uncharacterized protein